MLPGADGRFNLDYISQTADFTRLDAQMQQSLLDNMISKGQLPPGTTVADLMGNRTAEGGAIVSQQNINGQNLYVDESGRRLNENGTVVWDPKTATTDVYGGQFRYAGETRFARNKRGRLEKQYLGKDNKWHKMNAGKHNVNKQAAQTATQQEPLASTSFGVVSFNAGSG